ncbi:hypothetical protein ACFO4P_09320 [Epilithonimonas pallida]|uniref:Uncharacterized protein n=1 Tax=Epilithonimonas pallida TaxID=373671 RepID=A0ABY1R412_9FLAO|nr:hypothetical protein [Epilithonimonas pallida]SMP93289.1 hypothetical protein SAMN05421679_104376 [Epilithonimonas pallida]
MKKLILALAIFFCVQFSFAQKSEVNPIYIVDNVIVSNVLLHSFNPNDIESVQVYKSPSTQIEQYDDLVKNGLINIIMKKPQAIEKVTIAEAKAKLDLTQESRFFLNDIEVHNQSILISEDLLKRARILQPDKKYNNYKVPAISIETN